MTEEMTNLVNSSRAYREKLLHDQYRPLFHMTIPEGIGVPFDANAGIFHNGRYHMYYIFQNENNEHCFGHYASTDLLHWTCMPIGPAPTADSKDRGMFSGNAFIGHDGKVRIMFHGVGSGNSILIAENDDLTEWSRMKNNPMTPSSEDTEQCRSWDPFGWYDNGTYYAIYGWYNPCLFTSDDGEHFSYVGPFMLKEESPLEPHEDVSCPDFFKMNGKDVLMHISHSRGWQYEIGHFDGKVFHPEHHGRMNHAGGQYFAGESFYDDKGRRLLWTWVLDALSTPSVHELGWSGVMGMPRVVTMSEDKTKLYSSVPEEFVNLRYNCKTIDGKTPVRRQSEIHVNADVKNDGLCGVKLNFTEEEYVTVFYDDKAEILRVDYSHGSKRDDVFHPVRPLEIVVYKTIEEFKNGAPSLRDQNWKEDMTEKIFETGLCDGVECHFKVEEGENLDLRIFLDGSILEVFANDREAHTVRIYPTDLNHASAELYGHEYVVNTAEAFDISPTNMY